MKNIQPVASVETITPQVAKAYLSHNNNNRRLSLERVHYYARQMRKGLWKLNGETIQFDCDGNLINGQHRLSAIIEANTPVDIFVCRNIPNDVMPTLDQPKSRTAADAFYLNNITDSAKVSSIVRRYNVMCNGILGKKINREKFGRSSNSELLTIYNQNPTLFIEITRYTSRLTDKCKLFSESETGGTIAYLHLENGHKMEVIQTFFDLLFGYKEHPEYNNGRVPKCITLLRDRIYNSTYKKVDLGSLYKTQLLAKSWNLFLEGKDVKVLKVNDDETIAFN